MKTHVNSPESIDDGALLLSDVLVVPVPSFGVDRLTDGTQDSQRAEVVTLDVALTEPSEQANGGRSRVELRELVLLDDIPVAGWGRVDGSGFKDGGGRAERQRAVDDVGVASDPTNVGHAGEAVFRMNVEDVLDGESGAQEVASGGVDDALGLASGTGSLEYPRSASLLQATSINRELT